MKYQFAGHIIRLSGGKVICTNCGSSTNMMKKYKDENENIIYRCGICDDIDEKDIEYFNKQ